MACVEDLTLEIQGLINSHPNKSALLKILKPSLDQCIKQDLIKLVMNPKPQKLTREDLSMKRSDAVFDENECAMVFVGKDQFLVPWKWLVPEPNSPENVIYAALKNSKDKRILFKQGDAVYFSLIHDLLGGKSFIDLGLSSYSLLKEEILRYGFYHLLRPVIQEKPSNLRVLSPVFNGSSIFCPLNARLSEEYPAETNRQDSACPWLDFYFDRADIALTMVYLEFSSTYSHSGNTPVNRFGTVLILADANPGDEEHKHPDNPFNMDPDAKCPDKMTILHECSGFKTSHAGLEIHIPSDKIALHKYIRICFVKDVVPVHLSLKKVVLTGAYVAYLM